MNTGWWKLEVSTEYDGELNDIDKEHIINLIKQGFTEGELIDNEDEIN